MMNTTANISNTRIDWTYLSVNKCLPSKEYEVTDVLMEFDRHPSERNVSETYDVERALLDLSGTDKFVHQVYELKMLLLGRPIYVGFSPTAVKIGFGVKTC